MAENGHGDQGSWEPTHPETGQPLTPLQRVLWRFRMAGQEGIVMWRGFNNVEDVARDINADLMFGLSNQSLIIVSKLREIWDDFGSLAQFDPRVVPTRRAVQPFIDRIDVWPELRTFRNTTLAHAYLDKNKKLLPPTALIRAGKVPSYHAEIVLLLRLVVFTSAAVLQVFEDDYAPIDALTRDGPGKVPIDKGPGVDAGTDVDPALTPILAEVDRRCESQFGARLDGRVFRTFIEAINRKSRGR